MSGDIVIRGQRFFRDYICGVWRAEGEWSNPEVNEYEAAMLTKIEQLLDAGNAMADDVPDGYSSLEQWLEVRDER